MNIHRILPLVIVQITCSFCSVVSAQQEEPSTPGALQAVLADGVSRDLPLRHTHVRVEIAGFVARTTVTQVFHNPFDRPIEARYTYPLGDEAAVDDFELRCDSRVIRGEIRPREQARQIYQRARQEGYQAALLEQERPNIFIQSIANLMPGHEVHVRVRYSRKLSRSPTVIRTMDAVTGEETLLVRVAPRPRDESDSSALFWGLFVEDKIKPRTNLTVTVGLRVDRVELHGTGFVAPELDDTDAEPWDRTTERIRIIDTQLSPFLGLSWDPWNNGKTKLFVTARRYHDELHPALALVEQDPVTVDFDVFAPPDVQGAPPNLQLLDRDLETPYQDEWSLGFEREVFTETRLQVALVDRRYRNQLGFGNINTTNPVWGEVVSIGNRHGMSYRALTVDWRRRQYRSWELQAAYTYSVFKEQAPRFDPLAGDERFRFEIRPGYRDGDQRHRFHVSTTWIAPVGLRLGGTLRAESGVPYSIVESRLRPPGPSGGTANTLDFVYPTQNRNDLRNPSLWTLDARVARDFQARTTVLQLALEIFNLFDDNTYLVYNDARGMGMRIDGVDEAVRREPRRFQLELRLLF